MFTIHCWAQTCHKVSCKHRCANRSLESLRGLDHIFTVFLCMAKKMQVPPRSTGRNKDFVRAHGGGGGCQVSSAIPPASSQFSLGIHTAHTQPTSVQKWNELPCACVGFISYLGRPIKTTEDLVSSSNQRSTRYQRCQEFLKNSASSSGNKHL